MTIPNYESNGLLPPFLGKETSPLRSPYRATSLDMVDRFATTLVRVDLLENLFRYRSLLYQHGYTGTQFVDGSFVQDIEALESRAPGDIDVFSYLQRASKYVGDQALWISEGFAHLQNEILNRTKVKADYKLDVFGLTDEQFPRIDRMLTATTYFFSLFSHRRTTREWKGMVRINLSESDDQTAQTRLVERRKTLEAANA